MKNTIIFGIIIIVISSCFFDKKNMNVDPFYTKKIHLDFPVLPLAKPIFICYNKAYSGDEWSFEIPRYFKNKLHIQNLKHIGVDRAYIYGNIDKKKKRISSYKKGDYVFLDKYNHFHTPLEPREPTKDEIRIFPIDSNDNTFIMPERWFVFNVTDTIIEAFFSKKKYEDYLKARGISGKMYDINKYHKQYKETGIVPWFPDSVKVKLKK